jgi:hypothetical protein
VRGAGSDPAVLTHWAAVSAAESPLITTLQLMHADPTNRITVLSPSSIV